MEQVYLPSGFPLKIMITGARAPVALHLARLLGKADTKVIFADTFHSAFSANSAHCSGYIELPPPRTELRAYRDALIKVIKHENIQAIVPTCEEIFYLAQIQPELPIPVIAPPFEMLTKVHNKFQFIEYATQLGLNTPNTQLLTSKADVTQLADQSQLLVFKPVWSRFGKDVLLGVGPNQLHKISPTPQHPWIAQDYIKGTELSVYALGRHGKLVALSAYKSLYRAGKGAGICFEPVNDPLVHEWVETFVRKSKWEGQLSFDMMLSDDGELYPLECNPRATSGLHFFTDPATFSKAFWSGAECSPDPSSLLGSRLAMRVYGFPSALLNGRLKTYFKTLTQTKDILDWPDDPLPWHSELSTLATIAKIAVCNRTGLQKAATHDIEWNGPEQDHNSI